MDELSRWYENITYQEAKNILREKLDYMKRNFIAAGYYMKYIRDRELFHEDGYKSIWEFAEDNYEIKKSTASRWMSMNDKFSQGGNSPVLAEEFRGFEKSQLQEMLYLDDKQIETVTPEMTVKEIRKVRKSDKKDPIDRGCITGKNPNGNCVCCGKGGVECCGQCTDGCNSRCGWIDPTVAISQQAENEPVVDMNPPEEESDPEPEVITEENIEVVNVGEEGLTEELYEETSDQSDIDLLKEELEKAKNTLDLMLSCYSTYDIRVRKQKLLIGALSGMICDLDINDIPEADQPELPNFRNNDQRKEWLRDYKSWGLWYEDKNIGARYYKYDFDNGARLIAETYLHPGDKYMPEHESSFLHLVGGPEPPRKSGISKWVRHEKYDRFPSNETELVEFLKYVQKEGK